MTEQQAARLKRENAPLTITTGMFLHGVLTEQGSLEKMRHHLQNWFLAYIQQQDGTITCGPFPNQVDLYQGLDDFFLQLDKTLNQ